MRGFADEIEHIVFVQVVHFFRHQASWFPGDAGCEIRIDLARLPTSHFTGPTYEFPVQSLCRGATSLFHSCRLRLKTTGTPEASTGSRCHCSTRN